MRKRVFSILIVVTSLLGMCLRVGVVEAETGTEKKEMDKHEQEESGKLSISYKTIPGTWIQDSKGWWYRHSDGSYTINNWELIGGQWYYFDGQGYMYTGWLQQGSAWYYLDSSGVMRTGWIQVGSAWYYMNSSGIMQTGWLQQGGVWYYLNSNGVMQTGWLQQGGVWYFFDSNGVMRTGWIQVGGAWYYMDSSGAMQTGWLQQGGKWYYLNSNGVMHIGWLYLGGNTYYLNSNGEMLIGWWNIAGKWCYFDSNGIQKREKIKSESSIYRTLFAVPEGGWSSATVRLDYQEKYISMGDYVYYIEHEESVLEKCEGATVIPFVYLNILQYSDGTSVFPWYDKSILYDPLKWNSGRAAVNYNRYSFVYNTNVKGIVSAVIYCEGAVVPYRSTSVEQKMSI